MLLFINKCFLFILFLCLIFPYFDTFLQQFTLEYIISYKLLYLFFNFLIWKQILIYLCVYWYYNDLIYLCVYWYYNDTIFFILYIFYIIYFFILYIFLYYIFFYIIYYFYYYIMENKLINISLIGMNGIGKTTIS